MVPVAENRIFQMQLETWGIDGISHHLSLHIIDQQAHNSKVIGSSPAPATLTIQEAFRDDLKAFLI